MKKKWNGTRKVMAGILALAMCVAVPVNASAEIDEWDEEDVVEFKDKQGLTYSTLGTAKTIYDPTSEIEVSVKMEDNDSVTGKIVVPATVADPKTGKKYKVIPTMEAFNCDNITDLILPSSWSEVPESLCLHIGSLKTVTLKAKKVKSIGYAAFFWCTKLTTVKNINRVRGIGAAAFWRCESLKTLKLDSVEYIDDRAFERCQKLSSITIGNKFKKLGAEVFNGCKKLKTITIRSTKLKKVDKKAFKGISHKITVKVPKKKVAAYTKLLKNKGCKKLVVKAI